MASIKKKSLAAQELEKQVRDIACLRWGVTAQSEHIAGVNYDCILRPEADVIVAIEATCQNNIDKLRRDLNDRLGNLKRHYQTGLMLVRCYFVMEQEPSPSFVEYGKSAGVRVLSVVQFRNELLDYTAYTSIRSSRAFGSATNPNTGKNDEIKYISVKYIGNNNQQYGIEDIINLLEKNKKVVLLGEYGTGKSRCVHEIFKKMSCKGNQRYTFAINLRENWGLTRKTEILARHLQDLGLSSMIDAVVRISQSPKCCLLLDGFDEIGIQSWSADFTKVVMTRKASLKGVAELIESASGGVLITGREQYFNSDKEMYQALGISLKSNDVIILRCPDEFTDAEMRDYLAKANSAAVDLVPEWVPKRPMIYNILVNIEKDELTNLSNCRTSYRDYWRLLIQYICEREARIRGTIWDGNVILEILKEAAHLLLKKGSDSAHITLDELNIVFKTVTGTSADADASIILQRLPGLGRISSENPDRIFTDVFLLNGLKASYFMDIVHDHKLEVANEIWEGLISDIGYNILCDDYLDSPVSYAGYLKEIRIQTNQYLYGILVMLITDNEDEFDFRNLTIQNVGFFDANIPIYLKSGFSNLTFKDCAFSVLDITECTSTSLQICKGQIVKLIGIGNLAGKPTWIDDNCQIDACRSDWDVSNLYRSETLTTPQKALLSIIKKIFFQDWHGRQIGALMRGIGDKERVYIRPILNLMKREGVIEERVINKKVIFFQKRTYRNRMVEIQSKLTLSDDSIWREVSQMK